MSKIMDQIPQNIQVCKSQWTPLPQAYKRCERSYHLAKDLPSAAADPSKELLVVVARCVARAPNSLEKVH